MAMLLEKIQGDDVIFQSKEYNTDSLLFNAIESARFDSGFELFSDHKSVILMHMPGSPRVWIWTSSILKEDTNRLIDICRFLRDRQIPKAEIYLKYDIAPAFSDLYAIASSDINYVIKDELSLAVMTYERESLPVSPQLPEEESIFLLDRDDAGQVEMVRSFYSSLKEEFHWQEKFERKLKEYLEADMYVLVRNGKIIGNIVIGNRTDAFARVKSVAVRKEERRKGYGYQLSSFIVRQVRSQSLSPILYTHVGNVSAMKLWAKTGFKEKNRLCLLKTETSD